MPSTWQGAPLDRAALRELTRRWTATQRRILVERVLEHQPDENLERLLSGSSRRDHSAPAEDDDELWGALANVPPMVDHINRRLAQLASIEDDFLRAGREGASLDALSRNREYVIGELSEVLPKLTVVLERLRDYSMDT